MYENIIARMTLEQKAALCVGCDFWHAREVPEAGIPSVMMTDGPHGLRKQSEAADHLGINDSEPATCFPSGAGLCSSWNTELAARVARAIAHEAQAQNVGIVLGPAINIKRSPLCGRNFEYLSEDPYLAGEMAVSYVSAMQSEGVGTSVKHYAVNNQETARMTIDARVSERALREIYLYPFEQVARRADPKTFMCAYNRVNGVYACQHKWLLDELLRGEWGFKGFVMSDWGAVDQRVPALEAGLELQMPGDGGAGAQKLVQAVRDGSLDERTLNRAVERLLGVLDWVARNHRADVHVDAAKHHALAIEAALETMVLLKNEGMLPLNTGKLCVLGELAQRPIYQGGGSSHIKPTQLDVPLERLSARFSELEYARGYDAAGLESGNTAMGADAMALIDEAVALAQGCDDIVVFAGYYDTEGGDRSDMRLPEAQNALIERVAALPGKRVTVVLECGAPVEMPWADDVNAILMAYLGGQGVGEALARLLCGEANPSGRLAESFPYGLEDTPCYINFPGDGQQVHYREDIFVGYRYYGMLNRPDGGVRFPFGHGLSYTRFEYEGAKVSADEFTDVQGVSVELDVRNVGQRAGAEVVQLYVQKLCGSALRPRMELKGFEKVHLAPGESGHVKLNLNARAFAYWNEKAGAFVTDSGRYRLLVCASSQDVRAEFDVVLHSTCECHPKYHRNSCLGEILRDEAACERIKPLLDVFMGAMASPDDDPDMANMMKRMMEYMPLRGLAMMSGGMFGEEQLSELLDMLNG